MLVVTLSAIQVLVSAVLDILVDTYIYIYSIFSIEIASARMLDVVTALGVSEV